MTLHNHATDSAAALGKNAVSLDTRELLLRLFADGLTVPQSLRFIKEKYQSQPTVLADRSIVPDYNYV